MTTVVSDSALVADTARLERKLTARLGAGKFNLWFRSAQLNLGEGIVRVTAPNRFAAGWIAGHFRGELEEVARELLGPTASVQIDAAGDSAPRAKAATAPKPAPAPVSREEEQGTRTRWRHDLSSFVVGANNELAHNAAMSMGDGAPHAPRVLFLHGDCGLGKTHLLQGIGERFTRRLPESRVRYTTAEEFTNQFLQALRFHKLPDFRRRIRRLDLLLVDDVHFLTGKPSTQDEFLHTFDAVGRFGARVVLASDAHPKLIRSMRDALVSRFMSGMVVRVDAPDEPARRALIVELLRRRGLGLIDTAADRLAQGLRGSVRELEGAVAKLAALHSLGGGIASDAIGHATVSRLLETGAKLSPRQPVRIEQIIRIICDRLEVDRKQLMGKGRHKRVVLARSTVIHVARKLTTMSYPELAVAMGRPNHSTIVTASHRIQKQVREKKPLSPVETTLAPTYDGLVDLLLREVCEGE